MDDTLSHPYDIFRSHAVAYVCNLSIDGRLPGNDQLFHLAPRAQPRLRQ